MVEICVENTSEVIHYTTSDLLSIKYTPEARVFVSIILPIIGIVGLLINITFLYVVYRAPAMHTITNVYLVQLSISDMCTLSVLSSRFFHYYINSPEYEFYPGTRIGCTICDFLMYFTYFVGVNFICIVTVERYFALCRPMQHRVFRGRSRARDTSLVCWVLGFLLAITGFVPQDVVTICAENPYPSASQDKWLIFKSCKPSCSWCYHLLVLYDIVTFVIGFIMNVILYIAIIRQLRKRVNDTAMPASKSTQQASKDVTRMLIINGIAFFVLLGPYQIWNTILLVYEYMGVWISSRYTFFLLGWLSRVCSPTNFALNPLIYGSTNPRYRKAFLQVFGCSRSSEDQRKNQLETTKSHISTIAHGNGI